MTLVARRPSFFDDHYEGGNYGANNAPMRPSIIRDLHATLKYVRQQANIPATPNASGSKDLMLINDLDRDIARLEAYYVQTTGHILR